MKTRSMISAAAALGASTAFLVTAPASAVHEDAESRVVAIGEVPEPAREAILVHVADGQILGVEADAWEHGTKFEAVFVKDGRLREIEVSEDGRVLEYETSIELDEMTEAARDKLLEFSGDDGELVSVMAEMDEDGDVEFEVEIEKEGRSYEAEIEPGGRLVRWELQEEASD